jgi:hypothetical protein
MNEKMKLISFFMMTGRELESTQDQNGVNFDVSSDTEQQPESLEEQNREREISAERERYVRAELEALYTSLNRQGCVSICLLL